VSCGVKAVASTRLLSFLVQSSIANPEKLQTEILSFISKVRSKFLEPLTDSEIKVFANALLLQKTEPDKKISSEATRNWNEITTGRLQFDRRQKEAEALLQLQKEDILNYWDEFVVGKMGGGTRMLISEVVPKTGPASAKTPLKTYEEKMRLGIDDIDSYRFERYSEAENQLT
jgi:secreted Zn-dependent insulinase-like peptidase